MNEDRRQRTVPKRNEENYRIYQREGEPIIGESNAFRKLEGVRAHTQANCHWDKRQDDEQFSCFEIERQAGGSAEPNGDAYGAHHDLEYATFSVELRSSHYPHRQAKLEQNFEDIRECVDR